MNWYKKASMLPSPEEASQLLGVNLQGLTEESLQNAYRTKAKETHPDKAGNETLFKQIKDAYEVLKKKLLSKGALPSLKELFEHDVRKYKDTDMSLEKAMLWLGSYLFPPDQLRTYLLRKGFKPEAEKPKNPWTD